MIKYLPVYTLLLIFVFCTSCGQNQTGLSKENIKFGNEGVTTSNGPNTSVRTIKQDSKGNMWLVSLVGIIRYDGISFTNLTNKVGPHRIWDVLEDRRGNLWFTSIDSGVYYTMGSPFNFIQPARGLSITPFLKFMKIKPALFGSAPKAGKPLRWEIFSKF